MKKQRMVLIGGGIAHISLLKRWIQSPPENWELLWVSRSSSLPLQQRHLEYQWSDCSFEDANVDIMRLANIAGVRWIEAEVTRIDSDSKTIKFDGDYPDLSYERISIDGSSQDIFSVPEAASVTHIPVFPLTDCWKKTKEMMSEINQHRPPEVKLAFVAKDFFELSYLLGLAQKFKLVDAPLEWTVFLPREWRQGVPSAMVRQFKGLAKKYKWTLETSPIEKVSERTIECSGVNLEFDAIYLPQIKSISAWAEPFVVDFYNNLGWQFYDQEISVLQYPPSEVLSPIVWNSYNEEVFRAIKNKTYVLSKQYKKRIRKFVVAAGKTSHEGSSFSSSLRLGHWSKEKREKKLWPNYRDWFDKRSKTKSHELDAVSLNEPEDITLSVVGKIDWSLPQMRMVGDKKDSIFSSCGSYSFIKDPFLLGKLAANKSTSQWIASGRIAKTSEWTFWYPKNYSKDDIEHFFAGVSFVLKREGIGMQKAQAVASAGLNWFCNYHLEKKNFRFPVKVPKSGDHLILTHGVGFGILWAQRDRAEVKSQWLSSALRDMTLSMSPAANVFSPMGLNGCKVVGAKGLSGACLELLQDVSDLKTQINMRFVPRLNGITKIISRDPKWQTTLHESNWQDLGDKVTFGRQEISFQNDCLWDPSINGGWLIAVSPDYSDKAVGQLKRAGYKSSTVVGCIAKKEANERLALSDWEMTDLR